jgi:hypothetical protein
LAVPVHGLTCGALLRHLYTHYAEEVPLDTTTAALLCNAHGSRAAECEAAYVPRHALLWPRLALDGVVRATRDPAGCVYEVCLIS